MPTVLVHTPAPDRASFVSSIPSLLPKLLETPLGLAILELQGTINFPTPPQTHALASEDTDGDRNKNNSGSTEVGRLEFPDYSPDMGAQPGAWMRRVWLFVGHQRMTGEIKELKPALGLLRRRAKGPAGGEDEQMLDNPGEDESRDDGRAADRKQIVEELEILEVVKWKMVFRSRPEPIGSATD